VSAPESAPLPDEVRGLRLQSSASDIVEIAALRGRAADLASIALHRGVQLPALGRAVIATAHLALCVRPERWLILTPPASGAASADGWRAACAGVGAAVDLSSSLRVLELSGHAVREVLVRSCRIDLDQAAFPPGTACATTMAQVPVILVALPSAMLLLAAASTAQHVHEWVRSTAQPFGQLSSFGGPS
jgi:heterotetrameric sarcosine oxidase gamma subunit